MLVVVVDVAPIPKTSCTGVMNVYLPRLTQARLFEGQNLSIVDLFYLSLGNILGERRLYVQHCVT